MANALYNTFKQGLGLKQFDLDADVIKATLIDSADYTFNPAHTTYATDVPAAAKVKESGDIAGTWSAAGVLDSADFTFTSVTGDQAEALILWDSTNGKLIAYYDTGMSGMPVTPNGGNILVTVHSSGWLSL